MAHQPQESGIAGDHWWHDYADRFHRMEVPARTAVLREGEIPTRMFLVEKGCMRASLNQEGKDITFQFFFEGDTVASIESFKKGRPSPGAIETIEPCVLRYLYKTEWEKMVAEISEVPVLRTRLMDALFERTFFYMEHFCSFIRDTPLQRYQNLLQDRPYIVQRVPQHYIASYLGISPVHLSRIKGRLARERKP
ncbi:Crp/Fnr family transcriptional regulator [Taibaiella koreensis]|uniref:Crp/Fnr family transcriptional regulator n=1 Tax=Taibaiella koreensis TaxID=1268548 RepID=UPI000E59B1EA|nr:Crp/Fnr family transcriptional regulator [Taibaiella koreensis]